MEYYSQHKQDYILETEIFNSFKNGFFVDVGAHDGKSINNTLHFENNHNWTGINIEPLPDVFNKLTQNRPKCKNYNVAIDENEGESTFIRGVGYTEMISGLTKHYDPRHTNRLNTEINRYGGSKEELKVKTKRLESIFDENNIKHVHYLTIDVEGAEFAVIKSINFDKVFIDVIEFENNYDDVSVPIIKYLEDKGYKMYKKMADIFMIHNKSPFIK